MDKASRTRTLNDGFRRTFQGGLVTITAGVNALPEDVKAQIIQRVRAFSEFDEDNNPHDEHDFGLFEVAGKHGDLAQLS